MRKYQATCQLADCVAEDKESAATGEDGLVATSMIAATMRSLESGRPVAMDEILGD